MAEAADTWVVVVNWNGEKLLPACLEALARLDHPAHVLVVDNGSEDGSAGVVARFPGVEWLPLGKNTGFSPGSNTGFRRALAAGARFVATVNTDVRVEPEWLSRLVAAAEAHPDAGIFAGLLLFGDEPERVNSTGLVLDRIGRAFDRDFGAPLASLRTADGPVDGASGGAALYRAEALRRAGLYDPAYFAYYEDVDLSLRAARLGVLSWYVSGARALHGYGKSFGPGSPRQRYLLARNHMRCLAAHGPLPLVLAALPALTLLRAFVRAPLELLRGRPAHAWAHFRGAFAGLAAGSEALLRRLRGIDVPPGAEAPAGPG